MQFIIMFFLLGTIFGSFYMVVAERIPRGESIVTPPSHCDKCNHRLTPIELIPIFSYIIQGGKCRNCKTKLSIFYPMYEFISGVLFALAYISYGFNLQLIIALTFISMLLIVVLSDIEYMIISDGVLIVTGILLYLEIFLIYDIKTLGLAILNGVISFVIMFLLRLLGNFIFKKDTMGGGDIKLMFLFGLVLDYKMAILSIFLGSFIGLPISLFIVKKKSNHEVPFGPFLALGALIILLFQFNFDKLLGLYNWKYLL